jgi:RHS repeat-associated protein
VREASYTIYYEYDENDRLTRELWTTTGPSPIEVYGFRYAYDLSGNRLKASVNGSDTYYFYDACNRLSVKGETAAYANPTYYFYDRNGSLTNLVEPSGATYFAYNVAGLVGKIKWRDASATYFFYDGAFQRYAINEFGASTYFIWDGLNLLQERNADGTVKEEYTNAVTNIPGIGQLLETNRPGQAQQKLYPIMDPRGTITKWIQSDGTTVFAAREYDAFGTIVPNSAIATWPGRFGYQGQSWMELLSSDGSQRILLTPTRLYDPALGRFLQNEPLLELRQLSHYTYVAQNPLMLVDPLGLQQESCDRCCEEQGSVCMSTDELDALARKEGDRVWREHGNLMQYIMSPATGLEIPNSWVFPFHEDSCPSCSNPAFNDFFLPVALHHKERNIEREAQKEADRFDVYFTILGFCSLGAEMMLARAASGLAGSRLFRPSVRVPQAFAIREY